MDNPYLLVRVVSPAWRAAISLLRLVVSVASAALARLTSLPRSVVSLDSAPVARAMALLRLVVSVETSLEILSHAAADSYTTPHKLYVWKGLSGRD